MAYSENRECCDVLRERLSECRSLMDSMPTAAADAAADVAERARDLGSPELLGEALVYLSRAHSIMDAGARSVLIAREAVEVLAPEIEVG